MAVTNIEIQRNIDLFSKLLTCDVEIYTWHYDRDGYLVSYNCDETVCDKILTSTGAKDYMLDYAKREKMPLILSAQLGLMWGAAFEWMNNRVENIYVIGPVFNTEMPQSSIHQAFMEFDIPLSWRTRFISLMEQVPVVSSVLFFQDVLMLHFCVTGQSLSRSDLRFQAEEHESHTSIPQPDRHQTWLAEQSLLDNVRKGNLNFQTSLDRAGMISNGVRISASTPALQGMLSEAIFVSLCTRAAIEGGMSPDSAYTLGDAYIQDLMSCKNITEMKNIGHSMYEDFIRRVHLLQIDHSLSAEIQACKDYIEAHPDEDLSLDALARRVGYTPYYLSRKFKKETGISIHDDILNNRVEYAKGMLSYTDTPISEIAETLHFSSSSHFSDNFRKVTGMLPQAYRVQTKKI